MCETKQTAKASSHTLGDLIALLESPAEYVALPGYNCKESSRVVWVGPVYAVKCEVPGRRPQNLSEFKFYRRTPNRYRHLLAACYWVSEDERYLIAEALPRPHCHVGQWLPVLRQWRFLWWCWRQGLNLWELGKHDSWRFTKDGQPKLVDYGEVYR